MISMRPAFTYVLLLLALPTLLQSAPISIKEIGFLLRQETAESEIIQEVRQRKLLFPLNEAAVDELKKSGATDNLIALLKAPGIALTPEQLQAEAVRVKKQQELTAKKIAETEAAHAAMEAQKRNPAAAGQTINILDMLEGRLIRLEEGILRNIESADIRDTKVFAFYHSAMSNSQSRVFTPMLVIAYRELKAIYPEFEVIFVSSDKDDFNMKRYVKDYKMPWPVVRFDAIDSSVQQWASSSIPWLAVVNEKGQPLTLNAKDKQYTPPEKVVDAIRYILKQMYPQR